MASASAGQRSMQISQEVQPSGSNLVHQPGFFALVQDFVRLLRRQLPGTEALDRVLGDLAEREAGLHGHAMGIFAAQRRGVAAIAGRNRDFVVLFDVGLDLVIGVDLVFGLDGLVDPSSLSRSVAVPRIMTNSNMPGTKGAARNSRRSPFIWVVQSPLSAICFRAVASSASSRPMIPASSAAVKVSRGMALLISASSGVKSALATR
jgi:hypothetical protein